ASRPAEKRDAGLSGSPPFTFARGASGNGQIGSRQWAKGNRKETASGARFPTADLPIADWRTSTPRLEIFRIVQRLVADRCDLHRVGFAEILDQKLAALLAIGPGQVGERDVLADRRTVGDGSREGAAAELVNQRIARFGVQHRHGAAR